tara:strand:- start:91 stop:621 length:531 start_codon:yes stop_codon:yes gene_type:complete
MNKRGQVFLMAAILIAGIVVGLSAIDTKTETGSSNEAFYDLSEEVGFETKRVLDYGVFNPPAGLLRTFVKDEFLIKYKDYIVKEEVLFVYGDASNIYALHFMTGETIGEIGISAGGVSTAVDISIVTDEQAYVEYTGNVVTVKIREIDYPFILRDGQNFFFVIIKHEDEEKFVATG